eukprot:3268597-Rhodomonas_salina.3
MELRRGVCAYPNRRSGLQYNSIQVSEPPKAGLVAGTARVSTGTARVLRVGDTGRLYSHR